MSKIAPCTLGSICNCLQRLLEVRPYTQDEFATSICIVSIRALLVTKEPNHLACKLSLGRRTWRTLFKRTVSYRLVFTSRPGSSLCLKRLYCNGKPSSLS